MFPHWEGNALIEFLWIVGILAVKVSSCDLLIWLSHVGLIVKSQIFFLLTLDFFKEKKGSNLS